MSDSLYTAITENTTALMSLNGTLWVFIGVILTLVCGYLVVRYTLRG